MNERIRQLAEQVVGPSRLHGGDFALMGNEQVEKFAELIVQECINQVKEQYLPVMEDVAMMNDEHWKGYKHCGVDSVVAIKEHFGVEE